ncbi:unnamed protein product [Caenorhabditis angaria]|uniref:Uncharacterized protein n=1 Tax=Caenorhabditis angaria TaxID=860376 RepID=A0A9P1N9Z7_9PELO|nr:unnamed protein product [Caenorhabditis angaria]
MSDWKTKLENIKKEQEAAEQKHKADLEDLNQRNDSITRSKKNELDFLRDESEREESRRNERHQQMDNVQTKMLEQQNNNLQKTNIDYANQLSELKKSSDSQKEKEKERQLIEKTTLLENQKAQKLEAEKTKSTFNVLSENRIAEEKQNVDKLIENLVNEKAELVKTSTSNEEAQVQQRHQLEEEKNATVLKTQELANSFQNRASILNQNHKKGIASMIQAFRNDESQGSQRDNLSNIRQKSGNIKRNVMVLFHKFDVPIKMKNIKGLKKSANLARLTIETLGADIRGLKRYLLNLEQDDERKEKAKLSNGLLQIVDATLSRFNEYVVYREDLKSDSFADLIECLNELIEHTNKLEEIIESIPDIVIDSNFVNVTLQLTEQISGMFNSENAIGNSTKIEEVEDSKKDDEEK